MKYLLVGAAFAAGLVLPTVSSAEPATSASNTHVHAAPIMVTAPSVERWSAKVFNDLSRKIQYPVPLGIAQPSEGIVSVKFNCNESGQPSGIQLLNSSGHGDLDRATLRAVARIPSLHPLPEAVGPGQDFIIRMLFATSEEKAKAKLTKLRADAARNNERFLKGQRDLASAYEIVPMGG